MCRSRRILIVAKKFQAKTSQITAMAMSIGHSSSAYSRLWVIPSGRVIAAETMMSCQPQKWIFPSRSECIRVLSSRCIE
jgi:hypothetical protein